jgi:trimethylamine--corrinoid protein Co-methyltransferase
VVPLDVKGPAQEIVMERVTHENSRWSYGGGQATSAAAAEAGMEMSAVVGRPHELEIWVTSPLNLDPGGLDILWKLRHRRPRVRIANMPVRGMSAPVSLAGILAQTAAECLGAATLLRLLDITESIAYRTDAFWAYSVDMRSANVLCSGPDYLRLMTLCIFLARRYGVDKPMGKALLTAAKQPDAQAAAEKGAQAVVAALAGAGTFTAAGALSLAEIYSPVQMVIDNEILRWVDAYARPLDFSMQDCLLDVIDQVGPNGTFMDQPSTAERFREVFWNPQLFSMNAYPSWLAEGSLAVLDKARATLRALKLRDEPVVSREQQRELARIEKKFAAQL